MRQKLGRERELLYYPINSQADGGVELEFAMYGTQNIILSLFMLCPCPQHKLYFIYYLLGVYVHIIDSLLVHLQLLFVYTEEER